MEDPLDHKGKIKEPLLSSSTTKGGLRALIFIIVNEAFERLANYGLSTNLILYLTREYGIDAVNGAQILYLHSAATSFTPFIGAFLADTYVGRYFMIGFGCIACLLGVILLWLTTIIPGARPPPCVQFHDSCESASTLQLLLLYSSLGLMAIGAGGIRSSSLAFGADQLGKRDNLKRAGILESFFSWYYATVSVALFIAMTCILYIQDNLGWKVGFGIPVVLMILSTLSFFLASPIYVKSKAKAGWLDGFARVLVASFRNRSIKLSSQVTDDVYHHRKGSRLLVPSEKLRFLNKACVIRNPKEDLIPDGRASNPWSLCTVDEVEELKSLIKASTMDRHITSKFQVPAGSFTAFQLFSSVIWIALYDRVVIPLASKIRGKPTRLGLKQRIGIGILSSSAAMAALAIIESVRRKTAIKEGFSDDPNSVLHISALWLLLYFFITGFAEVFCGIGQNEFFYTELPKSMSSVASNLFEMGLSVSNLIASLLVTIVRNFFKGNDQESWLSSNINKGHYDYYYWLLAGLSLANFLYYRACSKAYGPCKGQEGNATDGGEASTDDED
ncbi:hypothetical protein H0E87_029897 [Populus deltoides]|uniref:Protein NRT1/ PTR FAMILY 1.2-like n=1 Tax=Populus deltoides TaxID=3696 RepID=A0A8T2WP29_POPDE|nr:hypothetical protein H0E87_029897 [Populus deltoides]